MGHVSNDPRDDAFWASEPEQPEPGFDPPDAGHAGGDPAPSEALDDQEFPGASEPVPPAAPGGPSRLQRLSGTLAVAAVLVVGVLFAFSGQGASGPVPEPSPTPTVTPVVIPDEARTSIYRSDTPASNEFVSAKLDLAPVAPAKKTNPYTVRVETTVNVDADAAARFIQQVLDDPRGWAGYGNNNFELVSDPERAVLSITIASPQTADELCGPKAKTLGLRSCLTDDAIVINSDRWHYMTPTFNNLDEYRAYAVNHQVGKFLGQRIAFCKKKAEPAPAMAEQDASLDGCLPNAWPKLN